MATLETRACLHCGVDVGPAHQPRYCSGSCRWKAYKARHPDALQRASAGARRRYGADLSPRPCKECGNTFTPTSGRGQKVFCSPACRRKFNKRDDQQKRPGKMMFRARARRYGVEYHPGISWRTVMERFGSQCALCGLEVPAVGSKTDPQSPTVDHILPMSRGGAHIWGNVQLAHRICNSYKCAGGSVVVGNQLAIQPRL